MISAKTASQIPSVRCINVSGDEQKLTPPQFGCHGVIDWLINDQLISRNSEQGHTSHCWLNKRANWQNVINLKDLYKSNPS